MKLLLASLALMITGSPAAPVATEGASARPIVIAHRGASGERPEHTLAAYELAIAQGADFIEPDLVLTRDGVLVARHENEISGTTDVADRPEFADRKATKSIDGEEVTGWFTEDFTLAELKTLRARERLPQLRPENVAFDGQFAVPTLADVIALVKAEEARSGRVIGLYPEMKHPSYFEELGFDMVELLVGQLHAAGYDSAEDPVFIQCFEVTPLARANVLTDLRLVQLIASEGRPWDIADTSYGLLASPTGLHRMRAYADGVGADIRLILHPDGSPRDFVGNAHEAGLLVHAWTLRRENVFMGPVPALATNDNPRGVGGLPPMMGLLVAAGVDGIFTDHPGAAVMLRDSGNYEP